MKARDVKGTKSNRIIAQGGKVLPKKLFAKYNVSDDPFLQASDEMEEMAEKDETAYVGEYQLVKTHKVELKLRVS